MCLPDALTWMISCFYKSSLERGFNDGKARQMVMRFFFNQIIVPLLLRPQPFLINTEVRASRVANFNLKKVTNIIQTLVCMEAGDDVSYLSSEARQFYENLDDTFLMKSSLEKLHAVLSFNVVKEPIASRTCLNMFSRLKTGNR